MNLLPQAAPLFIPVYSSHCSEGCRPPNRYRYRSFLQKLTADREDVVNVYGSEYRREKQWKMSLAMVVDAGGKGGSMGAAKAARLYGGDCGIAEDLCDEGVLVPRHVGCYHAGEQTKQMRSKCSPASMFFKVPYLDL